MAKSVQQKTVVKPRISKEEAKKLEELIGDYPKRLVVKMYNQWAAANGYPTRSARSIEHRASRMNESMIPVGKWLRIADIARMLGIGQTTIRSWSKTGDIAFSKFGGDTSALHAKRKDVIRFLRKNPQRVAGCKYEDLISVVEDPILAKEISQKYGQRIGIRRRIRCVENGRIYDTVVDAAKHNFVSVQRVHDALRHGGTAAGYHWEALR